MLRYIQTEQVLGKIFVNLIERKQYDIDLFQFYEIERKMEREIRNRNDAMIICSSQKVYAAVDDNAWYFAIAEGDRLSLTGDVVKMLQEGEHDKVLNRMKMNFVWGIPVDINETLDEMLTECV